MGRKKSETGPKPILAMKIDPQLNERLRRAAYWLRHRLSEIIEAAIEEKVSELENKHNKGKPFREIPEAEEL